MGGMYEFCQKVNIWQIYKQARYLILQGGGLSHPTPTPHPPPRSAHDISFSRISDALRENLALEVQFKLY